MARPVRALWLAVLLAWAAVVAPLALSAPAAAAGNGGPAPRSAVAFADSDDAFALGGTNLVEVRFNRSVDEATLAASEVRAVLSTGGTAPIAAIGSGAAGNDRQLVFDLGATSPATVTAINVTAGASVSDTGGDALAGTRIANQSVTTADATLTEGDGNPDRAAYRGETVALIGDQPDEAVYVESRRAGDLVIDGSADDDGQVFALDTGGLNASREYVAVFNGDRNVDAEDGTDADGDGETDEDRILTLREFDLSLSVNRDPSLGDADLTTEDRLNGSVTANVGGRTVTVTLVKPDDSKTTKRITLNGSGGGTFDFGTRTPSDTDDFYTVVARDPATGVSERARVKVSAVDDTVRFGAEDLRREERGDVVNVTVRLSPNAGDAEALDAATVRVGGSVVGYSANVTVRDGNGDGRVVLRWNTYLAGGDPDEFSVAPTEPDDPPDGLTVRDVTTGVAGGPTDVVAPAVYDLEVRPGTALTGGPGDVSGVVLSERSLGGVSVLTAPGARAGEFRRKADVLERRRDGNLTRDRTVAEGDLFVAAVDASGLGGALENRTGANTTARFFGLIGPGGAASLRINATDAAPNRDRVALNVTDHAATTVVRDAPNDTYYVVVDTDAVVAFRDADGDGRADAGEAAADLDPGRYRVNFTVAGDTDLSARPRSATAPWRFVAARATVEASAPAPPTVRRGPLVAAGDPTERATAATRAPTTDATVPETSPRSATPTPTPAPTPVVALVTDSTVATPGSPVDDGDPAWPLVAAGMALALVAALAAARR
ncbi:MAG: hypothetical protein ABEI39_01735 [Halobacteriales archaeon]